MKRDTRIKTQHKTNSTKTGNAIIPKGLIEIFDDTP